MVEAPKAKTVEEYLNEVSYADDANYIPSEFALKFVNFIKLVNGIHCFSTTYTSLSTIPFYNCSNSSFVS